ncbi:MAG: carboxypeptidase-like regulatory domain-containing protein [Saprospiraceae bacterium]
MVTDSESGEPLIGATIKIGGTGTVTDYNGKYSLEIESSPVEISASFVGYESQTKNPQFGCCPRHQA